MTTLPSVLDSTRTAAALPWGALAAEIQSLLLDRAVQVPARLVQPLPGGGSLFVMPALDARIAITKLITFTPANAGTGRATIQGDVVVFDVATGERRLILHGPTVTARRTAAVSLLAAQRLASNPRGPLLVVARPPPLAMGMGLSAGGWEEPRCWPWAKAKLGVLRGGGGGGGEGG